MLPVATWLPNWIDAFRQWGAQPPATRGCAL